MSSVAQVQNHPRCGSFLLNIVVISSRSSTRVIRKLLRLSTQIPSFAMQRCLRPSELLLLCPVLIEVTTTLNLSILRSTVHAIVLIISFLSRWRDRERCRGLAENRIFPNLVRRALLPKLIWESVLVVLCAAEILLGS